MKALIVAKTRQGKGACIGAISARGRSLRLLPGTKRHYEQAGMEYEVGDIWDIRAETVADLIPPHTENVVVRRKRKLGVMTNPVPAIERHMPPKTGGPAVLYEGLALSAGSGPLYITQRIGVPPYSTMFWRPDKPLVRDEEGKRIRYRYPTQEGGHTLTFVGFQEPLAVIPAGTLLRVSLAHWWRPDEKPEEEQRCYLQLSGWFLPAQETLDPSREATAESAELAEIDVPDSTQLTPHQVLRTTFGFEAFRPLQVEVIDNVLQGRDTLVVMPTGGGKSLCYQIPALLLDGVTVVVSPLISLMQDQVSQMVALGLPAVYLNSTLSYGEYVSTTHQIKRGQVKIVCLAPETLLRPETLLMLDRCRPGCLAIDEAHCISSWGHDFRPDYRQLVAVRERFPEAVCIALTATATPAVQADIRSVLGFGENDTFVASFDRPNLFLEVVPKQDTLAQCLDFLVAHSNQSGIVYCATRAGVESLTAALNAWGIAALPYHGGMDGATRQRYQDLFVRDQVPIMVATIAFGMGIDKPDVRFVVHVDLPKNMEHYYQQIGRAGRDGLRADCLLLYSYGDAYTIRHFIRAGAPSQRQGRERRLRSLLHWIDADQCRRVGLLAYFGETYDAQPCGMCDNCVAPQWQERTDISEPARRFLIAVFQTGQRFGANYVIKILRGSKAKDVLSRRHDKLACYSSGKNMKRKHWQHVARQLVQQGFLAQDEHGGLQVTAEGRCVLDGQPVMGTLQAASRPGGTFQRVAVESAHDPALFEQLRATRKEVANATGVPPYVVFSDRTLQEMATYFPQSSQSFAQVHGVGRVKLERYAEAFLPVIQAYCQANQLEEVARVPAEPSRPRSRLSARAQAVGEAFCAGESVRQLCEVYGVQAKTIMRHLAAFVEVGNRLPEKQLIETSSLSSGQRARVLAAFEEHGSERLRPIYELFGGEVGYDELHLMRVLICNRRIAVAEER